MTAGEPAVIVSLGVHIVDILGRPVTGIPPGQGRQLLDEIRITAAGTAAGTVLTWPSSVPASSPWARWATTSSPIS